MNPSDQRGEIRPVNWRGAAWITAGALALFAAFRLLPTGTNLHHMDFRVEGKGALEMCDPTRPQFIPVVAARSPVILQLKQNESDKPDTWTLTLATVGGKPIGPADLLTVHTRKLHLLVVDESLGDYQHLHPEPGEKPGEWRFTYKPAHGGVYRVFADFTPAATGRGLYAFTDYNAPGPAAAADAATIQATNWTARRGAWEFAVSPGGDGVVRAGQATALRFTVRAADGGAVPLEPVMAAYAHLVAFDAGRTGFAHLHPRVEEQGRTPDKTRPELNFDLMIPQPGRYVLWAQVQIAGKAVFAPFWFEVTP